jgi:hypothetical protein
LEVGRVERGEAGHGDLGRLNEHSFGVKPKGGAGELRAGVGG